MKKTTLTMACALIGAASFTSSTRAQDASTVELPGQAVFPESIAADAAGNLYGGSFASGGIWRVKAGSTKSEQWIEPGSFDSRSTFGVVVDEKAKLLWVCSNDVSFMGVAGPGTAQGSHLKGFDLASGVGKISIPLPGAPALCNDIALASDGSVFVTNSLATHVLRLAPGAKAFEIWAQDAQFTPPPQGAGLDGIAIDGGGDIYVNTFNKGELFRISQKDGKAGPITKLKTSRPLVFPDGLRTLGTSTFLLAEGGGTISLVTIVKDAAEIKDLKTGLSGPTGVALSGGKIWVSEGQLSHLFDAAKNGPPKLPFRISAVPFNP